MLRLDRLLKSTTVFAIPVNLKRTSPTTSLLFPDPEQLLIAVSFDVAPRNQTKILNLRSLRLDPLRDFQLVEASWRFLSC